MIRPTINSNNSYKLTLTWSRSEYYFGWLVCIDLCKMSNKLFLFLKYLFLIFIIFQLVILFHGFLFFSADVSVPKWFFLKIPTSRQKSHENHEQKNTQKITIITSNKPQNRGKFTDFFLEKVLSEKFWYFLGKNSGIFPFF